MGGHNLSVPAVLKALGRKQFPHRVDLPGGRYCLVRVFKHDFFAATGLFQHSDGHRVVLKIGRTADVLGLPARWIGRLLASREARIYQALSDLEGVPGFAGMWGDCGFAHVYVDGHPMHKDERFGAAFFDQLESLIRRVHERDMAYVDLEKCENIIVGDDGNPHLIDFQISWHHPGMWARRLAPLARLRTALQNMDHYHLCKHRRRAQAEPLTPAQHSASQKLPWHIKAHRAIVQPLQRVRRWILLRWDPEYHRRTPAAKDQPPPQR